MTDYNLSPENISAAVKLFAPKASVSATFHPNGTEATVKIDLGALKDGIESAQVRQQISEHFGTKFPPAYGFKVSVSF